MSTPASVQRALSLAEARTDLGDWNDVLDELDRIRRESKPPPDGACLWAATETAPRF
jgi:hypothetical protein